MIHVLTFDGTPIAAAERYERLNEHMTNYTPNQQALMEISSVEVLT